MKKFTLCALFAVGAMCAANAQDKAVSFGLRAGLNINTLTYSGDDEGEIRDFYKARPGFHVGAVVDCKVAGNFYIQPSIYITTRGTKLETISPKKPWSDFDYAKFRYSEKINMTYLQIPISASYRFPVGKIVKFDLNVGPYVAIGLGGKLKVEEERTIYHRSTNEIESEETESEKFRVFGQSTAEKDYGDFKRLDAGLRFGAGLHIRKFNIGLAYDLGLANIAYSGKYSRWGTNSKFRNGSFQVSVGCNF